MFTHNCDQGKNNEIGYLPVYWLISSSIWYTFSQSNMKKIEPNSYLA